MKPSRTKRRGASKEGVQHHPCAILGRGAWANFLTYLAHDGLMWKYFPCWTNSSVGLPQLRDVGVCSRVRHIRPHA